MEDQKKWHVAWARFSGFQTAPPSGWDAQTVEDFHEVLTALEAASGDDLTAFRIPQSRMKPQETSWNTMTGQATYTDELYCDPQYARRQVEGVAAYFADSNPLKKR